VTDWTVRRPDHTEVIARIAEFESIYAEVYREPPYEEDDEQAADFAQHLADHREQPGFSMVVAEIADGSLVGFAYGLAFPPERWWRHATGVETRDRDRDGLAPVCLARRGSRGGGAAHRLAPFGVPDRLRFNNHLSIHDYRRGTPTHVGGHDAVTEKGARRPLAGRLLQPDRP
jgi:hypothetical protein